MPAARPGVTERAKTVIGGFCQDYADYRYAAGFFEGLNKALEIAAEIKKEQDRA